MAAMRGGDSPRNVRAHVRTFREAGGIAPADVRDASARDAPPRPRQSTPRARSSAKRFWNASNVCVSIASRISRISSR